MKVSGQLHAPAEFTSVNFFLRVIGFEWVEE
jgi:hypothetical protein